MFSFQVLTMLAILATTSNALYFHLNPFTTSDIRVPSESHAVSFTVNVPNAVYEQGGSGSVDCVINWDGCNPATCWTQCPGGYAWWARVTPGSYKGANDFSIDVQRYYVYKNSASENATMPLKEGNGGYACSRGGQSTVCTFQNDYGVDSETLRSVYGPIAQYPEDVCGA